MRRDERERNAHCERVSERVSGGDEITGTISGRDSFGAKGNGMNRA